MNTTEFDRRGYLPHFIYEMVKAGVPHSTILSFRRYWKSLPAQRAYNPCPHCFTKGIDGPVTHIERGAAHDRLLCGRCQRTYVLRHLVN